MKVGVPAGLLVVLSGCDILFQLKDVHGAAAIDAAPDAGCGSPDEDGDCIADDLPDPTNFDGHSCYVSVFGDTAAHDTLFLQEAVFGSGGGSSGTAIPGLQPGDDVVISLRRHRKPDGLSCFAIINGTRYSVNDVTPAGTWSSGGGHVGVDAGYANARVRYVVTYVGS